MFIDSSLNITGSRRQPRRTANSQATPNVPIALPAKTKQCKPSVTVEDIYLNRLWRSQMPKEKALESILESPTSQQHSGKPTKRLRCLKFDDAPNRTKLRQRRQKAVKNGWKPLTKKQNAFLDSQMACKLAVIDGDLLKANGDITNDSCLPTDNATLQQHDTDMSSGFSNVDCAAAKCVENVADHSNELSAGFQYNTYTQQVRIDACGDAEVSINLLQREKNTLTEYSDKSENTLEQQNERHVYSEPHALSIVEKHSKSAATTAVQLQGIDKAIVMMALKYFLSFSPRNRGSMFLPALVCVSVCDHDN